MSRGARPKTPARAKARAADCVDAWLGPDFLETLLQRVMREPQLEVTRGRVRPDSDGGSDDDDAAAAAAAEINKDDIDAAADAGRSVQEAEVRRVLLEWSVPGRSGEVALVVKAEPGGKGGSALRRMRFFAKERAVYGSALPDMTRLVARHLPAGSRPPPPLAPDYFPCDRLDALVIEDLRAKGFSVADASRGLNLEHCTLALRALARFHAGSVAMRLHRPDSLLDFREAFFTPDNDSLADSVEPALAALADAVDRWPGYERFGPKIRDLRAVATQRLVETMQPQGARPLVLNHGDFWTGSLLFRYDSRSGAVAEARMQNFQLARWGSPALDLQFFLYTSPSEVVRAQYSERLLEIYHLALAAGLAALKCFGEVPSLEQLRSEMTDKALLGLVTALSVLGGIMGGIMDGGQRPGQEARDQRYRQALQRMLPLFEAQGLL